MPLINLCFCDIPIAELSIHVKKYSCFGLSFSKQFIIGKGGKPVLYIPKQIAVDLDIACSNTYFFLSKLQSHQAVNEQKIK